MKVSFFESPWKADKTASLRLAEILASGSYIGGKEVAAFESEFSEWLGGRPVVGVNSGTDALHLALVALGIGPGDDVLLPSYTFIACLEAVLRAGAAPMLVDCAPGSYLPGLEQIEPSVTSASRAVIAVPLFGDTAGLPALQAFCHERGLLLIEDVAQACGGYAAGDRGDRRLAGTLGQASAFSFYPTKTLGGAGDCGAVSFRDAGLAERVRALANHGMHNGEHREIGLNSRLDALQAGLLRIGLGDLSTNLSRRSKIAEQYLDGMANLPLMQLPSCSLGHAWNYFVLRHPNRDRLQRDLAELGIETRVYYSRPIHREPAYLKNFAAVQLPNCERLAQESLALPFHPKLSADEVDHVIDSISRVCRALALHA